MLNFFWKQVEQQFHREKVSFSTNGSGTIWDRKERRRGGRSLEANLTSYTKINSDHRSKCKPCNYISQKRIYRGKSLLPKSREEFLSVIPKA